MQQFVELLRYLTAELRRRLLLLIPLLGISGVLEVVSLASLIPLGTTLLQPESSSLWLERAGLNEMPYNSLLVLLAVVAVSLFSAKAVFVFMVNRYALHTAAKARAYFQSLLFESYVKADFGFHLSRNSSEYLRNITTECSALDARFLTPVVVLASEIVPVLFILAFLLVVNPWGVLVASAIFTVAGLLIVRLSAKRLHVYGEQQLAFDGDFVKLSQQSFHNPKEICLYPSREKLVSRAKEYTGNSAGSVAKALTINTLPRFLLEILSLLTVMLVAALSIWQGSNVEELVVELGVFFGAVVKLLPSSSRIVSHFQALNHSYPTVANIVNELIATKGQRDNRAGETDTFDAPVPMIQKFEGIRAKNLCFSYGNSQPLFSDISFDINRGEVIGLIGETGSGKTTLVNILLGLMLPTRGELLVNDQPLQIVKNAWGRLVSYVPQEIYIMDDTVSQNVAFFESPEEIDSTRVMQALEAVGMAEFVSAMEEGLYTKLGEHGSRLSGGQRQRIGIARALYREPDVIFFDEATSALDNQTEMAITDSVGDLKGKKTIVIIAHRMSSLRYCDRVLKLGNGVIEAMTAEQFHSAYAQ